MERLQKFILLVLALGVFPASAANFTVSMKGFQYAPKDLAVNVGDTVTWVNEDATLHDTSSGMNGVEDGVWKSPLLSLGGSFSFTFNVAPGTYPYFCTPHYVRFNMVGSITVLAPNDPPSVAIANPPDGAIFTAGTNVLIEASASDDGGMERVEFFANGNLIGTDFTAPYTALLDLAVAGNYSLTARAFDAQGAFATSLAANILVEPPPEAPTIVLQPESRIVLPGDDVTFSVEATGTPPLFYQWQFNGANILGATTTSFSVLAVEGDDLGNYSVVVSNIAGAVLSATASLTFEPGTQDPVIAITGSPKEFSRLTNSPVLITGTASDDILVKTVEFRVNNGAFVAANGTTNWMAEVALTAGMNVIEFRSVDFAGNVSTNAQRTFFYVVNGLLVVEVRGSGTVSPNLNDRSLQIGKNYQMIARPGPGRIFSRWEGAAVSNQAVLNFQMESNLVLTAHFIPNPFPAVKGIYTGLIFEPENIRAESSGFINLQVTSFGRFTGKLTIDGKTFPLHGRFDHSGNAEIPILRRPLLPVLLMLSLDLSGIGGLTGEVTDGEWISSLTGKKALSREIFLERMRAANSSITFVPAGGILADGAKIIFHRIGPSGAVSFRFSDPATTKISPVTFFSEENSAPIYFWFDHFRPPVLGNAQLDLEK